MQQNEELIVAIKRHLKKPPSWHSAPTNFSVVNESTFMTALPILTRQIQWMPFDSPSVAIVASLSVYCLLLPQPSASWSICNTEDSLHVMLKLVCNSQNGCMVLYSCSYSYSYRVIQLSKWVCVLGLYSQHIRKPLSNLRRLWLLLSGKPLPSRL